MVILGFETIHKPFHLDASWFRNTFIREREDVTLIRERVKVDLWTSIQRESSIGFMLDWFGFMLGWFGFMLVGLDSCWAGLDSCWVVLDPCWVVFDSYWVVFDSRWVVFDLCWVVFDSRAGTQSIRE